MRLGEMLEMEEISFECKRCGKCCRRRGDLPITPMELVLYCNYFNMTAQQFLDEYANIERAPGELPKVFLKHKGDEKKTCIFFEEEKGCTINPIKPAICYLFPFFQNFFSDNKTLIQVTPCVIESLSNGKKEKISDLIEKASCGRYGKEKINMKKYIDLISNFELKLKRGSYSIKQKQMYIDKFYEDFFLNICPGCENYLKDKFKEWDYIICFI